MRIIPRQHRRALRHAQLKWSEQVEDPRDKQGQRHLHQGLLALLVVGFACGKAGLRHIEELSQDVGGRTRKQLKVPRKVSDSTLRRLLEEQSVGGLAETVRGWVQALLGQQAVEHALPLGVASFDGKSVYSSTHKPVPGLEAVACDETGTPVYKLGAMRAALTSVAACPCLDLEFFGAKAGESPAFRQLLPRVVEHYGEHFQVVTGDAGLCAAENAALVRSLGKHYLLGLKGNQPTLHGYAVESIADKKGPPRARTQDRAHGKTTVRELWTHALKPGEVDFPGARLLLCVKQTHLMDDGTQSIEWRYFVTSLSTVDLSFAHLLKLVRLHWAIENRHHWTLDMVLQEDARQPCCANASALQVTAWLRTLAYNLLAAWRAMLPRVDGLPVRWERACETLRDALVHGSTEACLPTPV
ncbi:MAG: ISAs1 family transposase [Gemmatimonadota bacterium]|nr:ISAs1 family transposase [Gemmatimonadota bacterium]